jgi:hypothetical protein
MKLLTCASVRRRLTAFHDRELPVAEEIAVAAHLEGCPPCARDLAALAELTEAVRLLMPASRAERQELAGLRADVLSRLKQERDDMLPARLQRFRDDMHLLWIAMAAAAATLVCGTFMAGLLYYASPERDDSLAALISVLASPGSNENPLPLEPYDMQFPSPGADVVPAALVSSMTKDEAILTLQAIVTREGTVGGLELLSDQYDAEQIDQLLEAISRARFAPAQQRGAPVAVNMVWLLAHTTVHGGSGDLRELRIKNLELRN